MNPPIYNPNVPEFEEQELSNSQPDLFDNFMALATSWALNHVPFLNSTTPGNHTIIQLLERPGDPNTSVNEISVYTKNAMDQTDDHIYLKYGATGQVFQYTCYQIYALPQTATQTQFFTFLPGKVLLYFGTFVTLPNNRLTLLPPVAKKIITVSAGYNVNPPPTLIGKPGVALVEAGGFITQIIFSTGSVGQAMNISYLIMAAI
jgi:hypothetical protein